ncbi:fimbrin/plastin [Planoprotostelium fungivorum]|uniref:Fimbrin/plastin n=1 Tax=Planoprotostelium fungivorum TaxID=1890364 RepID=A0A2P6NRP0_9EUKA|nr:fimbrin/plastin [Planoprotostelium fungivorum]
MSNKLVIIVTGANKGIGKAIVKNVVKRYPNSSISDGRPLLVYLTARDEQRGKIATEEAKAEIGGYVPPLLYLLYTGTGLSESIEFHQLDTMDHSSIQRFSQTLAKHNGFDILINNAGVASKGAAFDNEIVRTTVGCNYYGTLDLTKALLPLIRPQGRIINVSSMAGKLNTVSPQLAERFRSVKSVQDVTELMAKFSEDVAAGRHTEEGWPSSAYKVSKMGVTALTIALSKVAEAEGRGVKVNCCCPGWVQTDMTSNNPNAPKTPDEGADTPVFLALDDLKDVNGKFWEDRKTNKNNNMGYPRGHHLYDPKTEVVTTTTTYYYAPPPPPQTTTTYTQQTQYYPGYGPGQPAYDPNAAVYSSGGLQYGQQYPPQQAPYQQPYYNDQNYSSQYPPPASTNSRAEDAYAPPPTQPFYTGTHSSDFQGVPNYNENYDQSATQNYNQSATQNYDQSASQFSGLGNHGYDAAPEAQDSSHFSGLGGHAFDGHYGQPQSYPPYDFPPQQQPPYQSQSSQAPPQPAQLPTQPPAPQPVAQPPAPQPASVQTAPAPAQPAPAQPVDVEALQAQLSKATLSVPVEEVVEEVPPMGAEEKRAMMQAIVGYINSRMGNDPLFGRSLPVDSDGQQLFKLATDGVLFNKLLNIVAPGTVDERTINSGNSLNVRQIEENIHLAINSARSLGCDVSKISVASVLRGNQDRVIQLLWSIINNGELSGISLARLPYLSQLLLPGETPDVLESLSPIQLLLRWFNYQLSAAGVGKRVSNFGADVCDSEAYTYLINQISPSQSSDLSLLQSSDRLQRAEAVITKSTKILPGRFIDGQAIVSGNQGANAFFTAQLFRASPSMGQTQQAPVPSGTANSTPEREKKAFVNWANSLGVDPQLTSITKNTLSDGLVLLQLLDKIQPGIVNWSKVHRVNPSKFQQVEHCNYALQLCSTLKGFSIVNISGVEIQGGTEKLSLAVIWQLMRYHVLHFTSRLSLTEESIIRWANEKVASTGRTINITDLKDKSLSTSHFIIDLLTACRPGSIDYTKITMGRTPEQKLQNASYAISCARKLGCPSVFLLPEDIAEVNSNLILTLFASIMQVYGPRS